MARRLAAALVLAVGATSCFWAEPGYGPERTAFNASEQAITPDTVGRLAEMWRVRTAGGAARFPILSEQGVHVVDDRHLYGFDNKTGTLLWRYDAPAGTTLGPAIDIGRELLFVGLGPWGSGPAEDYATLNIEAATGVARDARSADGWVVTMDELDYLVERFSRTDPEMPAELAFEHVGMLQQSRNWTARIFIEQPGLPTPPSPTLGYFVYQAGQGPLVDPSGRPLGTGNGLRGYYTTAPPTGECSRPPIPVACPAWSTGPLGGTTATSPVLAARGEQVFTGTDAGVLYAIDGAPLGNVPTGTMLWSVALGSPITQSPALANGVLYVPTADGELVAVEAATGTVLWRGRVPTGSSIDVQPAVAGGVVYTGSADGTLHAFAASGCDGSGDAVPTCPPLWSADTGDAAITGAPAVAQGQLFAGTADGRLVAYGLPA